MEPVEQIDLSELKADPRNARRHPQRQRDMLATTMQKVGTGRSIVITEDNTVLAGHATVGAAGDIGVTKVRVVDVDGEQLVAIRRSGLTDEQQIELAVADNRVAELAEWDTDSLINLNQSINLADLWRRDELEAIVKRGRAADPSNTDTTPTHANPLVQSHAINAVYATDAARAQAALGDKYDPTAHYIEATCYHCGESFFVDRKVIIGK